MRNLAQIRMLTCAAALVLALAATELAGAAPLITNGGFESGFTGWTRVEPTRKRRDLLPAVRDSEPGQR